MPPPKKGSGKDSGKGKDPEPKDQEPKDQEPRSDETGEYELGDDFLSDLTEEEEIEEEEELEDEEELEEETVAEEELDDEEIDEDEEIDSESELEEVVNAETQEWDGLEAAEQAPDEPTLVASARSKITSGYEAIGGDRITSGFKAVGRHIRFPLWARFLTASLVIVMSVGTATAASLILYIGDIGERLKNTPLAKEIGTDLTGVDGGEPQTIMIIGSDKRPEDKNSTFRGLSDTTMLLRVDPDHGALALFSLPRDLAVDIPGYGRAKLNEAYANGGPALALKTVKQLTGLEINHLVNVDFEGFARAVNAIDCVYADVDRRYFNKNDGYGEDYEEIDLQPGYQALCGFDALDYARYRHTDNDVVRAARQQDFLREARQKVPPEVVFADRKELIDIFTEHTTSSIDSAPEMLQVLKLFVEARDAQLKEVHFEGTLGPSFVTTTPDQIEKAVNQFLGIEDTPGARGESAAPEDPGATADVAPDETGVTPATPSDEAGSDKKAKKDKGREKPPSDEGEVDSESALVESSFGRELARGIRQRKVKLPIYYPTMLEAGTDYDQKPRVYKVNGTGDGSPPNSERAAYKWVFSRPALGEYYGFMATRWVDPPILKNPSEEREIGDRTYKLFYDGDRLRIVAWQTDEGSFWVSNTLIQSLSDREMLAIAKGMTELPKPGDN